MVSDKAWVGSLRMFLDWNSPAGMAPGDGKLTPVVPYALAHHRISGLQNLLWLCAHERGSRAFPLLESSVPLAEAEADAFVSGVRLLNLDFQEKFGCIEVIVAFDRNEVGNRAVKTLKRHYERLEGTRLAEPNAEVLADVALRILAEGFSAIDDADVIRRTRITFARDSFIDLGEIDFQEATYTELANDT